MPLPLISPQSGATSNDLLELRHGTYFLVNDYKATGLAIHARSEQF